MADGTRVLLARHGQTAWHEPERYAGSSDIPLDRVGLAQAEALARHAARLRPTTLAASPLVRAAATAAPVAAATGLPVRTDSRLRELDFGLAEGRGIDSLREEHPEVVARFLADPAAGHFPGGEPPTEGARRVTEAVADLVAADPGGTILVIAHGTLIRLLLCTVLEVPLRDYRRRFPRVDSVALTELRYPAVLDADTPDTDAPDAGAPDPSAPDAGTPDPGTPAMETPGTNTPDRMVGLLAYNAPV